VTTKKLHTQLRWQKKTHFVMLFDEVFSISDALEEGKTI
jgi:hypothetical protein